MVDATLRLEELRDEINDLLMYQKDSNFELELRRQYECDAETYLCFVSDDLNEILKDLKNVKQYNNS